MLWILFGVRKMTILSGSRIMCVFLIMYVTGDGIAQDYGVGGVQDIINIVPRRQRREIKREILDWRMENLLPKLMEQTGIDMWVVIDQEDNLDPVSWTLVGGTPGRSAARFLVLYNKGRTEGVERIRGSFGNIRRLVEERNPETIGINVSKLWRHADGLSVSNKQRLEEALGGYESRLVPAENLVVEWRLKRSPQELSIFRYVSGITHDLVAEAFSNMVIVPDITTTNDVAWSIRQKITDIGVYDGFFPTITLQRSDADIAKYNDPPDYFRIDIPPRNLLESVIRRGDVISADWGIAYIGLFTDVQQVAYVLRKGESDVPEGLKEALRRGNRLQDILAGEFQNGRTGNEILFATLEKAKSEKLRPEVYSHPVGYHGHEAGPSIGREGHFDEDGSQLPTERGEYPMRYNSVHSMELDITYAVPEWNNKDVRIVLEEEAAFTEEGMIWMDGRQKEWYSIR